MRSVRVTRKVGTARAREPGACYTKRYVEQETINAVLPGPAGQLPVGAWFAGHRILSVVRTDRLGTFHVALLPGEEPEDEEEEPDPPEEVLLRVVAGPVAESPALRGSVDHFLSILEEVSSPWVAPVLDRGQEGDRTWYALGASGPTLLELVRRGRSLEESELLWLGRGLCAGLLSLHAVGLAHGNLSPEHVVLGPRGPLIVDLGWSARLRQDEEGSVPLPRLTFDLRALGGLLVLAARGTPAGERGLPGLGLSPRLAELLEPLLSADERTSLLRVARAWEAAARESGTDEQETFDRLRGLAEDLVQLADTHGDGDKALDQPALGAFGRYVLLEEVARGGMGVVYRARHADFERTFALKVMLSGALADAQARARFLREAEAAASLDHPAIVRVHDCGEVDGRAYIAMDFAEGRPLSEELKQADLPGRLLPYLVKVVRAVHYAHSRGVVHRDLKPDNLRVGPDGEPRILDFGVAKRMGEGPSTHTLSGELVGTPAYMPPEQAEGRGQDIDTRSDVYALGATIYQCLTRGTPPFSGGTVTDVLTRVLLEEPPPPSSLNPEVPWELDAIVLKALEKEPDRRYQSAAELAEDLERYLAGWPIRARQATWPYRVRKWVARRKPQVALGAALSLVVLGLLARQWSAAWERNRRVEELLSRGQGALESRAAADAKDCFLQALALAPDDPTAILGKSQAEQLLAEEKRQRDARGLVDKDREHAAELVRQGEALLAGDDLPGARRALEQALGFDQASKAARDRLLEVERRITERETLERARKIQARDQAKAALHEAEGNEALEKGDLAAAQAAYLKAVAFGSESAEDRLTRVQRRLDEAHLETVRTELKKRDAAEAARLLGAAREALARGEHEAARNASLQALAFGAAEAEEVLRQASEALVQARQAALQAESRAAAERLVREGDQHRAAGQLEKARTAYAQALAFDGASRAAQKGLVDTDRELRARERTSRTREAEQLIRRAREKLEEGRRGFRADPDGLKVRDAYLFALDDLHRALLLDPESEAAKAERAKVASELVLVLREQGANELADFLRRFGGFIPETRVDVSLPRDPHLAVIEVDAVSIRRAFGSSVRFEPTRELDRLRERVQKRGDRWKVEVQVKSEATPTIPPQVLAKGLWIRLEDRQARTVTPWVKLEFQGGPYTRPISIDAHGRVVASFGRSRNLDAERWVREAEETVERLIAEAAAR